MLILLLALVSTITPVLPSGAELGDAALLTEPIDRNLYLLGPGDVVAVVIEGGCTEALLGAGVSPWASYMVTADGYLSISGIGSVDVGDLTLNEAQYLVHQKAAVYYPSIRLTVSLLQPGQVRVGIRGMVEDPGTYIMTSLSRVSDLVWNAGGISAFGSRYGTMISADGDTLAVDLHISSATGMPNLDPFLETGASVNFDVCTEPVYILRAGMLHPGTEIENPRMMASVETWELNRSGDDLISLMDRMGGIPGNVNLNSSRIFRDGSRLQVWSDAAGLLPEPLIPGDTIMLVVFTDSIAVGGAVGNPGMTEYRPESTVHEYIIAAGGPVRDTSLSGVKHFRDGIEIASGGDALANTVLPGDAIEVPYNWVSRNKDAITIVGAIITIWYTVHRIME